MGPAPAASALAWLFDEHPPEDAALMALHQLQQVVQVADGAPPGVARTVGADVSPQGRALHFVLDHVRQLPAPQGRLKTLLEA
jgi:hypothetical protein